jgi:hypothetical protein
MDEKGTTSLLDAIHASESQVSFVERAEVDAEEAVEV